LTSSNEAFIDQKGKAHRDLRIRVRFRVRFRVMFRVMFRV